MFGELLPKGHESEFFGLYEVTDKGSSWLRTLLVGIITTATGSIRYSFFMLFFLFTAPIYLFWSLDLTLGKDEARTFAEKGFKNVTTSVVSKARNNRIFQ
jgi:UMF1 family MFS transporter